MSDVERITQQVLTMSGTGMYMLDDHWRFLFFNEIAQDLMPDPAEVVVGRGMFELNPMLVGHAFGDALHRAGTDRVVTSIEAFSARLQGWYDMSCYPVDMGIAVYCRNITEEHETQMQLESARRRLHRKGALLDAASDAIYVRELDGTVSYWNRGAERIFGWSASEMVGRRASDSLYTDSSAWQAAAAAVMKDGQWIGVLEQNTRDGRVIQVHCRWQLSRDNGGVPAFILCMGSDLTLFKREQDRNYRAQRMESLGTLAGGIAHDLNNVLTPVLIAVQLLREDERSDESTTLLQSIESSVTHGANLVRQVLSFARGQEGVLALVEISELVDAAVAFARDTLPKTITVRSEHARGLGSTMCDRTQILQILINLVVNARDAMPDGGMLTITVRTRAASAPVGADGDIFDTDGHLLDVDGFGLDVVVEVEDSGVGMDSVTASRVFEPFFTTKAQGEGTGLGLSTALAIAKGHGGGMEVYSELGLGTRFQLRLPVLSESIVLADAPREIGEPSLPRGDGQLIVVVDDDDAILALTRKTLERHGYRTLSAANGLEATQLIDADPGRVDLVLTDMMMPVLDGAALIAHLGLNHPGIPVIAASGLTAHMEVAAGGRQNVRFFLPKPFSASELLQSVAKAVTVPAG